jgi:hypothetical protein
MSERIPAVLARVMTASLLAVGALAMSAAGASASRQEVVYNNLNTVAAEVNGYPNEDTYSLSAENFPAGGLVEFSHTRDTVIKNLTTEVDSFSCERGSYYLENCYTVHPKKKFQYGMIARIYRAGPNNEPEGGVVAYSEETMHIPYRPTTNVSCPATSEGKGFGPNCDVGGFLAKVKFKHFHPVEAVLPVRAVIEITETVSDQSRPYIVNVGLQSSYKEYNTETDEYVAEPPANGGVPAVGTDPLPNAVFIKGALNEEEWEGFQPVFEVVARP